MRVIVCAFVFLLVPLCSFAQSATPAAKPTADESATESVAQAMDADVLQQLLEAQIAIRAIEAMSWRGDITSSQRDRGVQYHLGQARAAAKDPSLTRERLLQIEGSLGTAAASAPAAQPELTWGQRVVGFFTFVNILWTLGGLLVSVCVVWLLITIGIPAVAYEFLGYVGGLVAVHVGMGLEEGVREYVTFFGALLLIGMPIASIQIHKLPIRETGYFFIATLVSFTLTFLAMNSMIGWLAAVSLMGLLGFSALVIPCGYAIGFTDEDGLSRGTSAGLLLVIIFTLTHIMGRESVYTALFADAMLWTGTFVGYLGLLISSSRWYSHRSSYLLKQIITIAFGIAALFAGSVFGIPELQQIGGTFFVLYIIEKFCEIPVKSLEGGLLLGAFVGVLLFVAAWVIKANAAALAPYLLVSLS